MFSLSGEAESGGEIEIDCNGSCASYSEKAYLYKDMPYSGVLCTKSDLTDVFVNGIKREFRCLGGENGIYVSDIVFDKAGKSCIEIFSGGEKAACITFEVCVNNGEYKEHFEVMTEKISSAAKHEVLAYIRSECEKAGIKIKPEAQSACDMLRPAFLDAMDGIGRAGKRKYYSGDLHKNIKRRRNAVGKCKSLNIYDIEENRKAFKAFAVLADFADKLMRLCADERKELEELVEKLRKSADGSVVLKAECPFLPVNICKGFAEADSSDVVMMYKFFCFSEINRILSEYYQPLDTRIFKEGFDIYQRRQTTYINTENDNVITLIYNSEPDTPAIFIRLKRKDKITSHSRAYAIEPVYKKCAGERERNLAFRFKGKYKPWVLAGVYAMCFSKTEELKNVLSLSVFDASDAERWIQDICGDKDLNEYPPFEETVCDINKEEFNKRDVLVAVVKTKSQFNINIKERFYYIPAHFIENGRDIRYVALYQSKALFGGDAAIRYFGEVEKISKVPRYKISEIPKNSDELYLRFEIKSWQMLEREIKPKDFAEVCMFTNMYLLHNAKSLPELYATSFMEYVLSRAEQNVNFRMHGAYFKCRNDEITVWFENGEALKFNRSKCKTAAHVIEKMLKM